MKHYCIFEFDKKTKKDNYVMRLYNYEMADEICESMNNFRRNKDDYYFHIRCLEDYEYNVMRMKNKH